jgi:hypothetical protein
VYVVVSFLSLNIITQVLTMLLLDVVRRECRSLKGVAKVIDFRFGRCPQRSRCELYRDNGTCNAGPFDYCGQYRALNERPVKAATA